MNGSLHTGPSPTIDGADDGMQPTSPVASVVTTVFNRADILARAMESVLEQSFTDYEYIVVDDGSTDGSADVAESFADARVRVFRCPHRGRAAALNTAFAACMGEFILIQDSDDIALPGRFEKQIAYLREHPEVGMLGCQLLVVERDSLGERPYILPQHHRDIAELMLLTSAVSFGASAIRKSSAIAAGDFNENLPAAEDYDFQLRLLDHCEFANLPLILERIHIRSDSQSVLRSTQQRQLTRDLALAFLKTHSPARKTASSEAAFLCSRGRIHYYHDEMHEARGALSAALRLRPWWFRIWRYYLPTLLGPSLLLALRDNPVLQGIIAVVKRRRLLRRYFLPLL